MYVCIYIYIYIYIGRSIGCILKDCILMLHPDVASRCGVQMFMDGACISTGMGPIRIDWNIPYTDGHKYLAAFPKMF